MGMRLNNKLFMFINLLFIMNFVYAGSGDFFRITESGQSATINIQLCLSVNGATPWTCENHTITKRTLSITTVTPNHTYPAAGIKVLTPGYSLTGCTFVANGYCQFSVSNKSAASINVPTTQAPNLTGISANSGTEIGNVGVTLTGSNLTFTTAITFGGVAATSINVINDTTVTAVTPSHAVGVVDVTITTPYGSSTMTDGYTYQALAIGQSSRGGIVACIEDNNYLIIPTTDNGEDIVWGGIGTNVAGANSITDGASNTSAIVATVGDNGGIPYAAKICSDYEIDSQGNTPCQSGNTCYNNWFLPAGNNTTTTGQLNCLYVNHVALGIAGGDYWSSTQQELDPANFAYGQNLFTGDEIDGEDKNGFLKVRCVQSFTP